MFRYAEFDEEKKDSTLSRNAYGNVIECGQPGEKTLFVLHFMK